jgi:hypothetical protein
MLKKNISKSKLMVAALSTITIVIMTATTQAYSQPERIEVVQDTESIIFDIKPGNLAPDSKNPSPASSDFAIPPKRHRHETRKHSTISEIRLEHHHRQLMRNSIRHRRNQESVTKTSWIGDSELTGSQDLAPFIEGIQKNT